MLELILMVVLADNHLDHMEASLMRRLAGLLYIEDVDSGKAAKSAKAPCASGLAKSTFFNVHDISRIDMLSKGANK